MVQEEKNKNFGGFRVFDLLQIRDTLKRIELIR